MKTPPLFAAEQPWRRPLGKTVTTAFAHRTPGPTRNPGNLEHTPGGSSSGSAAGVAAGMVPFTIGEQTRGSILRPASFCGVTGFKPTHDLLSMEGVLRLAKSLDHSWLLHAHARGYAASKVSSVSESSRPAS